MKRSPPMPSLQQLEQMTDRELREKFKAWMLADGFPEVVLKEDGEGEFCYGYTGNMWAAFKAGASLSTEERGEVVYEGECTSVEIHTHEEGVPVTWLVKAPMTVHSISHGRRPVVVVYQPKLEQAEVTIRRPKEEG
jgi:hypothetical protein